MQPPELHSENSFSLTDAPLAAAVELGALQVVVVTGLAGVVLVVVVVFVVLGPLNDIVSRTSSKQKAGMLIMAHSDGTRTKSSRLDQLPQLRRCWVTAVWGFTREAL